MPRMVETLAGQSRWRILDHSFDSAAQNLSLEEALVRTQPSKRHIATMRLWVNPSSIILGRFQDPTYEADIEFCRRNGIEIARRFTGGGTVFEDAGTLNVTLVNQRQDSMRLPDFRQSCALILVRFLASIGLAAQFAPPNSILVSGKKIAGAAAGLKQRLSLWHASILVSTDIQMLTRTLAPSRHVIETHGYVHSNWMPVTSVQDELTERVDVTTAKLRLISSFEESTSASTYVGDLTSDEKEICHRLFDEKYSKDHWNLHGHEGVKAGE